MATPEKTRQGNDGNLQDGDDTCEDYDYILKYDEKIRQNDDV